ncbi:MAG TPA: DivIVA domain-containing protein [Actinomycetota bacterium]|nr:DivIVA domain-containing protein [Actinomycetota bacterium]
MRRKDKDQGAVPAPSTASSMITPLDIQQKEFQVSRFGGYRMRDVDEFLDQLTDAMSAVLAENERLRAGAGSPPLVGSPDLDEVARQADEIIQRARDEAARIVAEANERAASLAGGAAAGAVTGADRAAVDAFLARERAFLQSLASLVQEHADGVKGMARDVRRRSAPSSSAADAGPSAPDPSAERSARPPAPTAPVEAPAAAASVAASEPATEPPVPSRDTATGAEPETRAPSGDAATEPEQEPEHEPEQEPEPTRPITPVPGTADDPIVVSEPEPARTRREDDGDQSLRELFWGEES